MIERLSVVIDDRNGNTREVYASRSGIVYSELLADCPERYSVQITPLSGFGPDDYLVEVTTGPGGKSARSLRGIVPFWVESPDAIPTDAYLVAAPDHP
ncbi:MAG: hypothetical protein KC777_26950 [Cyanobacteria bacterium HKST-UBA02]|nr:hypothetical protein [Cyanobacteria bacterium HKST-UBA02]